MSFGMKCVFLEKNYLDVDGGTKNATEDGSDDDNTQSIVFSLGQDVHNSVADGIILLDRVWHGAII